MSWRIPLFKISWDERDVAGVSATIREGMNWAEGEAIREFEDRLARYLGARHTVSFNSGTSALQAAAIACGIEPGDEVIVPAFTFIATANTALFVGARPVFADIEETTLGLDPLDVERKINDKTRAIIAVHFGGFPCRLIELKRLAEEHNLLLIEDAAEALGAEIDGRKVGAFGEANILSFCQNKIITTGEGGAVATDSDRIFEKLRLIRSHGRKETHQAYFSATEIMEYVALGYNFRMSTISASLGLTQLDKIGKIIALRRDKAAYMTQRLEEVREISLPGVLNDSYSVYQMFPVRVKGGRVIRDSLRDYLAEKGVMTRVYFEPVHLTSYYRKMFGYQGGELPVTEKISGEILSLPMYPGLMPDDMDFIVEQIIAFFRERSK